MDDKTKRKKRPFARAPKRPTRAERDAAFVVQLGHLLRVHRQAHGLTQEALARAAGISRAALNMIELGRVPDPRILTLRKISRVLGRGLHTFVFMSETG